MLATTTAVLATALATGGVAVVAHLAQAPLWVLVVGVLVAAGISGVVAHLATRATVKPPLDRVTQVARGVRQIADGDRERLPEVGDGATGGLASAVNAVVERLQGEVASQRGRVRLLSSLVERSPNGVLLCGENGRIQMMNAAFREMMPPRGEPIGRRPVEVLGVPEVQELVDLAAAGEVEDEVRVVPGERHLILWPILTEGGELGILAQDLTRWRAAERARTDFVANVSHELRTPMAAILGYADTLAQDLDQLPEVDRPLVEAIARNSRRLRDTFEGLMHLAKVEARAGNLTREPLRLEPLLVEAVVPAVDAASRKDIDFELDCPEEAVALTNAEALDVIVSNLANNAVKYTPAGGTVRVVVGRSGSEVRIDVVDTGIGIESAHHERVFERFFRVDEGRVREVGGTGLGLAMVKHLALATGARLSLTSTPGKGSTFSVHLPAGKVDA